MPTLAMLVNIMEHSGQVVMVFEMYRSIVDSFNSGEGIYEEGKIGSRLYHIDLFVQGLDEEDDRWKVEEVRKGVKQ